MDFAGAAGYGETAGRAGAPVTIGFVPQWPLPAGVHALVTTRVGGVSMAPYASLNLGSHVGDTVEAVRENRARLRAVLPAGPRWLEQVHGNRVVDLDAPADNNVADAAIATRAGVVCAVMAADCLPVLFATDDGRAVGVAHAGWRGLANGVIAAAVEMLCARSGVPAPRITAYLGPAIGPTAYEVGADVHHALASGAPDAARAFAAKGGGKYWLDLALVARQRLSLCGLTEIYGGDVCTASNADRFFSYRRDGRTGRFASLIWRT